MPLKVLKLKKANMTFGANDFSVQLQTVTLDPGAQDGEYLYSYGGDEEGVYVEDTDYEPTMELVFYADWRANGVSEYFWNHAGETVDFVLDHHPYDPTLHVQFTGKVKIQPAPVGGEVRTSEMTEITLQCVGLPVMTRVGA